MHGCLSSYFCVVLSCVGRGLCDGLITRPKEYYCMSVYEGRPESKGPFAHSARAGQHSAPIQGRSTSVVRGPVPSKFSNDFII
jgi:hypothetical protein